MCAYILETRNTSSFTQINTPRDQIPNYESANSILELGKQNAPALSVKQLLFKDGYINDRVKDCERYI
jgi:hypothetical protein